MKKVICIGGGTVLAFCILSSFFVAWIYLSQTALQFLVKRVAVIYSDIFTVEEVTGSLSRGVSFSGLSLRLANGVVEIEKGYFRIRGEKLFNGILDFEHVALANGLFKKDDKENIDKPQDFMKLSDISLPVKIVLESCTITNMKQMQNNEAKEVLSTLQLAGAYQESRLEISECLLAAEKFGADISGELFTEKSWPVNIAGRWSFRTDKEFDFTGFLQMTGDVGSLHMDISFQQPLTGGITTQLSVSDALAWRSEISLLHVDPALAFSACSGDISLSATVSGRYTGNTVETDIAVENGGGTVCGYSFSAQGAAHYDGKLLGITTFDLKSTAGRAHVHGSVGENLDLLGTIIVTDAAALYPEIHGNMDAKFHVTGPLAAPDVEVRAKAADLEGLGVTSNETSLFLNGALSPASRFQISLQASDLKIQNHPIKHISLNYSGRLDNHDVELLVDHEDTHSVLDLAGGLEREIWQGQVTGFTATHTTQGTLLLKEPVDVQIGHSSSEVERFCLYHQAGSICSSFLFDEQKWEADLELVAFDPVFFISSVTGDINAFVELAGDLEDSSLAVTVSKASGIILDRIFEAKGHATIKDGMLHIDDSSLHYGDASIVMEGALGRKNDFTFLFDIADVSLFFPERVEGALFLKGNISGDMDHPVVDAVLQAGNLRYEQYNIASLTGKGVIEDGAAGNIFMDFAGSDLEAGAITVDSFSLKSAGIWEKHTCEVNVNSSEGDFTVSALLHFTEDWQIVVEDIQGDNTRIGNFVLQEDTIIQKENSHISMTPLCLDGEAFAGCIESLDMGEEGGRLRGNIRKLDISLLPPADREYDVSGIMSGHINLLYNAGDGPKLQGELSAPQIAVAGGSEDNPLGFHFSKVDLVFSYADKKGEASLVALPEKGGKISTTIAVVMAEDDFSTYPLTGNVQVQLADLSLVELLSKEELRARGHLAGDIAIEGSVGVPELHGDIALHDGALEFTSLGSRLENLTVDVDFEKNTTAFTVHGISGEGSLSGTGEFRAFEGERWSLEADITAKMLNAIRTEEYDFILDAQLAVACNEQGGTVKGDIQARDGSITILSEADVVSVSKDVVFIDGSEKTKEYPLETSLWIDVDENVKFTGYGLTTGLSGSLLYESMPGMLPVATGEITAVDGVFSLYTTDLNIERGRLLFKGGVLENPGIDIRAVREVADKEVGVSVGGTLEDMKIELFSDPVMEENDIIAYLVIGKSMKSSEEDERGIVGSIVSILGAEQLSNFADDLEYLFIDEVYLEGSTASGDMSVVFGKYLMDDLFIGYDHSFYKNLGEFKIRYDLGHGFSIETQTSSESSGGDLMYTIDL